MQAKTAAVQAMNDAYGRTQQTPAGMFCRMGRIDRAYDLVAAHAGDERYQNALRRLLQELESAEREANRAMANYLRICRQQQITPETIDPNCDCPVCSSPFPGCKLLEN